MEQKPIRGAESRSLVGTYVSSDLMLWQALCGCFPTLFIFFPLFSQRLPRLLWQDIRRKSWNRKSALPSHDWKCGFILASGQCRLAERDILWSDKRFSFFCSVFSSQNQSRRILELEDCQDWRLRWTCSDGSLPIRFLNKVATVWQNPTVLMDFPKELPQFHYCNVVS